MEIAFKSFYFILILNQEKGTAFSPQEWFITVFHRGQSCRVVLWPYACKTACIALIPAAKIRFHY